MRRFGPDYPVVLAARQLLSRTQATLRAREKAIALITDVVERRERGLGPEQPFTAASRRLLDAYRARGGGGRSARDRAGRAARTVRDGYGRWPTGVRM